MQTTSHISSRPSLYANIRSCQVVQKWVCSGSLSCRLELECTSKHHKKCSDEMSAWLGARARLLEIAKDRKADREYGASSWDEDVVWWGELDDIVNLSRENLLQEILYCTYKHVEFDTTQLQSGRHPDFKLCLPLLHFHYATCLLGVLKSQRF